MALNTKTYAALTFSLGFFALTGCDQNADPAEPIVQSAPDDSLSESSHTAEIEPSGKVIEIAMVPASSGEGHEAVEFAPRLVSAEIGDTVRFSATDSAQRFASIATMLPEGARGWEGDAGRDVAYVLPKPGIYGFQSVTHYAAGGVGVIVVSAPEARGEEKLPNLDDAREANHPGRANPVFFEIFEEARNRGLLN